MHLKALLVSFSLVSYAAAEGCTLNDVRNDCIWEGKAPFCGASTSDRNTPRGDGRFLVRATDNLSAKELLEKDEGGISQQCYDTYGAGCWSGYKTLWCKGTLNHLYLTVLVYELV